MKLLVVPSAKLVPVELQTDLGRVAAAMVPLGGKPGYLFLIEPYLSEGWEVILAVHDGGLAVRRDVEERCLPGVRALDVGDTSSLGETVLRALESVEAPVEELVIQFADTLLDEPLGSGSVIAVAEARNLYRWTCLDLDSTGRIQAIMDRFKDKSGPLAAVVGAFRFGRPATFRFALETALAPPAEPADPLEPFYLALQAYWNALSPGERTVQRVTGWADLGHLDTYHQAKQSYWSNKRFFNSLSVHRGRGVIRKESRETKKFADEIRWYLRLPKALAHLAPRLFDWSLDPFHPWVEMEYYGYPALNEMYLFGEHDLGVWAQVLGAVGDALDAMSEYRCAPADPRLLSEALQDMYEGKTLRRLAPLAQEPLLEPFFRGEVRVGEQVCPSVASVLERLPALAGELGLYQVPCFTVVHGDFCLSNILYDPRNCAVRLIDPRGSFGAFDLHGDPRYDLAKLAHSVHGDYDLLVNGMFHSSWSEGHYRCVPHLASRHRSIKALFRRWLLERAGAHAPAVALIESLLFLSMVPLHADYPERQRAFLAKGLAMFHELWRAQACGQLWERLWKGGNE